ncbi:phosphoglycerate mutase family protein [uncultured Bacteroides sp.]|uniref:phosphoglycerate mutase family protein n=1 Tax=uncultured Bacteroides sp. TaxID=162156 RepID=UPI002600FD6C|nr:phosphoglycerate mutase family protein [uncultured Bacteroides sp.]
MDFLDIALQTQQKAWKIIEDTHIIPIWESVGAKVNLVGSLKTGLLMKHRDIDFHIYSSLLNLSDSFRAMAQLAENPSIKKIEYTNLLGTEEECIEWHAWYQDTEKDQLWQIDMIHIRKGSRYDGYFEKVAERISTVLTDEMRQTILRLKYETPEVVKIMGIEYYQAVIRDGVQSYPEFEEWRNRHPATGIIEWMP